MLFGLSSRWFCWTLTVDTESLLLFGQLPVSYLSAEVMQQMLTENRNHCKYSSPVLSLSENADIIEVHFKLTQLELEATEDIMEQLIAGLEYWRIELQGRTSDVLA